MPEPPPRRRRSVRGGRPWRTTAPAGELTVTQLASRVMKARGESICPACRHPIGPGVQIGQVGGEWLHVVPCITGGRMPMIGPSNEPAPDVRPERPGGTTEGRTA